MLGGVLCSCGKHEPPAGGEGAPGEEYEVRKTFGAGPVKFTVELSAQKISTADVLRCRMTLDLGEGYEAEFPDVAFPEDMPGAILTGYDEQQRVENGRRLDIRNYEFEPENEGTLKLPGMEVYYHRADEVKEQRLETSPIEIMVEAAPVAADGLEIEPPRGLITVEQMEAEQRQLWPWVVGGVLGLAALTVLVIWLARRPRRVPPPRPAHEVALERLGELARLGLMQAGQAEPFFVAVTTIVREYIEQAFNVRAPEQTTEEFLAQMANEPKVAGFRNVLEPFLTAADLVKFARSSPGVEAMQHTYATAEEFIRQTAGLGGGRS